MLAGNLESELTQSLTTHFLFSQLPKESLGQLAQRFEVVTYKIGQTVVAEGEPGDAAYLLHAGKLRVVKQGPDGKPLTLATLSPGEFLGEHALIQAEPRTATVRASQESLLFRLRREDFLQLLEAQPDVRDRFEQLIEHRGLARFLQTSTIFNTLPAREIAALLGQFSLQRFGENDAIVREGEAGERMFVLTSGEAKVVKGAGGNETVLAYLGAGDYFGERALLRAEPRYAGVVALSNVECAVLGREQFDKLVSAYPQIRERLARHVADYAAREEAARKFGLRAPAPPDKEKIAWQTLDEDELPPSQVLLKGRRRWFGWTPAYPFIPQEDETDCGAASLAMIARFYNVRLSIERLRDLAHVGSVGASGLGLMQAAEKIGYECRPVNTDFGHLKKLSLPAIAHWKGYHFLVVYEANDDRVLIGDPADGLVNKSRAEFEEGWTGGLFLLTPTAKLGEVAPSRSAWRWLRAALSPFVKELLSLTALSLLLAILQITTAFLIAPVVDRVLVGRQWTWLIPLSSLSAFLAFLAIALAVFRRFRLRRLLQQLHQKIAVGKLDRVLQTPQHVICSRQPGAVLERLEEADVIVHRETAQVVGALFGVTLLLVGFAGLFFLHLAPALIALASCLAASLVPIFGAPRLLHDLRRRQTMRIREKTRRRHALSKQLPLKRTVAGAAEVGSLNELLEEQKDCSLHAEREICKSGFFTQITLAAGAILALVLAACLVVWDQLTAGQFAATSLILVLVFWFCFRLVDAWPAVLDLYLFLQQQADFQDIKTERLLQRKTETPHLRGGISLQDVAFRHSPEAREVLSNLQMHLEPARVLWVVGRSGAGKTALANLLQGLFKPTSGTIRFDGHDLLDIDLPHLRRNVQVVTELPEIISASVRDNITLSSGPAEQERVINAAKLAHAHEFIMALPLGYETQLGAPGIQLSASQQQQVCIARAALADPRVLILDDATALLDSETERDVRKSLRWFATGRTLILMTRQRPEPLPTDDIIVLDEGRIVERGTRSELLEQRGLYFVIMGGGSPV